MPVDLQEEEVKHSSRSKRNVPHHVSNLIAQHRSVPSDETIADAAKILNDGKKVVILAGRGAIGAGDLIEEMADILGAAIAKPLLGKMSVPDDSSYCTGSVGLLGTKPSHDALDQCDTLFIVGSSFPYIEFYPKIDHAQCVQLDVDPARIGLRFPAKVGLVGDTQRTLERLVPLLQRKSDRAFIEKIREAKRDWQDLTKLRGTVQSKPMKPQVVAHELNKLLRDDAIIVSDSGTIATWYARQIQIRKGQMCSLSGNLATMACGLPYAIGAQIAYPDRQVVALVGDGGFTMLMAEMLTAKKYDLPVKIVVFKNNALGQIKWEQMGMLGNPEYVCELQPFDFVKYAEACGVVGLRADDPKTCGEVLRQALAAPGPAVIEAVIDPHEPPMPAHIEFSQGVALAKALAKGTEAGGAIIKTIIKDRIRELT